MRLSSNRTANNIGKVYYTIQSTTQCLRGLSCFSSGASLIKSSTWRIVMAASVVNLRLLILHMAGSSTPAFLLSFTVSWNRSSPTLQQTEQTQCHTIMCVAVDYSGICLKQPQHFSTYYTCKLTGGDQSSVAVPTTIVTFRSHASDNV